MDRDSNTSGTSEKPVVDPALDKTVTDSGAVSLSSDLSSGLQEGPAQAAGAMEDFPQHGEGEQLPHQIGKFYRVLRKIGEGGMGCVYEVEHIKMGKRFAAKVIAPAYSSDRDAVKRFELEAVAASKIDSPHIVQVVHMDTEGEQMYIIMELLKGRSLASLMHRRTLPIFLAVAIARQVAQGLAAAHRAGIVHRDMKPENIFLTNQEGQLYVKILDFGISKMRLGPEGGVHLTKTGQVIGTPLYFSPEQARGLSEVDGRTDLYALGVILYEMVTGRPVFHSTSPVDLMVKHATEPPPSPRASNPLVPQLLEEIILKCLAKDPACRYQTAEELIEALDRLSVPPLEPDIVASVTTATAPLPQFTESTKIGVSVKGKRGKRSLWLAAAAGVLCLALLGFIGWYFLGGGGKVSPTTAKPLECKSAAAKVGIESHAVKMPADEAVTAPQETKAQPTLGSQVTLTLTSNLKRAEVIFNDRNMGEVEFPFIVTVPRDGAVHRFEVKAKGFKPEKVELVADDNRAQHVPLLKIKKAQKIDIKLEQ